MDNNTTTKKVHNFNKPAYVIFIIAGICFSFVKDYSQAVVFWGLALVFDPFNINQPFDQRPRYQRIWLFVHVGITAALFGLLIAQA